MSTVLVTGGTGFIASHCILQLLASNHTVRTTIRSPERQQSLKEMLARAGCGSNPAVSFFSADLRTEDGWKEAIRGCDYVIHAASPTNAESLASDDEFIIPALDGTLRILRAAAEFRVKRVVITSSFSAISHAPRPLGWLFTESDWTDPNDKHLSAYTRSKTKAERAAWDFINSEGGNLELAVVNPVRVLGPPLSPRISNSLRSVCRLLRGGLPGVPRTHFGVVDVRDLAALHIIAMSHPAARNQRFIATSGSLSMAGLAKLLRQCAGGHSNRIPTRELPNWLVKVASLRMRSLRNVVPELGRHTPTTSLKAVQTLSWRPRSVEETVSDMVAGMHKVGLVDTPAVQLTSPASV